MRDQDRILTLEKDDQGVAILTYDLPGQSMNVITEKAMKEFDKMVDLIAGDEEIKSVVLMGKPDNFLAGADISMLQNMKTEEDAYNLSRASQATLNRLEALRKPVIAAINGPCLGGGLEVALACHYRIATTSPKTVLGLPEVNLGLVPGAGGTQRLPRLIPLDKAMDGILGGKQFRLEEAKSIGLVDEAVPVEVLKEIAYRRALALAQGKMEIRRKQTPLPPAKMLAGLYQQAKTNITKQTKGLLPAPMEILEAIYKGLSEGMDVGLEEEARRHAKSVFTKEAASLMHIFFMDTAAKTDRSVAREVKPCPVKKIGVLGAGIMGAGIAAIKADKEYVVRLKDADLEAAARGLKTAGEVLKGKWLKMPKGQQQYQRRYDLISVAEDYSGFKHMDLVIEAVFEDVELKHRVIKEVEAVLPEQAIFASNTSAIPIARLAEASRRPSRFLGLHYFSPVHRMPLIEIIITKDTAPEVVATAWELSKKCGKTPIIVNDGVGFYTTRVIFRYIQEAMLLLNEGARMEDIDQAAMSVGFPVGPITVADEVGLDTSAKASKILAEIFEGRVDGQDIDKKMAANGRFGRKNEQGFYEYRSGKKIGPDPNAYDLTKAGRQRIDMALGDIAERLLLAFCGEAALCLQENVLRSPRDGDVGGVFGIGFPSNLGGPFFYMDTRGIADVLSGFEKLEDKFGARFTAPQLLRDMAKQGKKFFQ